MHPTKTQVSLSNSSVTLSHPTPPSPPAVPTAPVKALTGGRRQGVGKEEQSLAKLPKFLRSNPGSKITWTHHAKGPGITKCFAAITHEVYAIAQVTAKNFQAENPAEICQRSHSAADRQIYTCRTTREATTSSLPGSSHSSVRGKFKKLVFGKTSPTGDHTGHAAGR